MNSFRSLCCTNRIPAAASYLKDTYDSDFDVTLDKKANKHTFSKILNYYSKSHIILLLNRGVVYTLLIGNLCPGPTNRIQLKYFFLLLNPEKQSGIICECSTLVLAHFQKHNLFQEFWRNEFQKEDRIKWTNKLERENHTWFWIPETSSFVQ